MCYPSTRLFPTFVGLLLLVTVATFPDSAFAQQDITVTVPEVDPDVGETVTLSITADLGGTEVDSYTNMEFSFDSSVINVVDVRDGEELSFGSQNFVENEDEDLLRVTNAADNAVTGSGEFLEIDVELTEDTGTPFELTPTNTEDDVPVSVFEKGETKFEIDTINQGRVGNLDVENARQQGPGNTAAVTGTVTRAFGEYVRFQDESGSTGASGLTVGPVTGDFKQDIGVDITKGTRLYVRGTLSESDGLLRISGQDLEDYKIQGDGTLPTAQEVSLSELQTNGEDYESELLQVDGLSFPSATGTFDANTTYEVEDETASLDYRVGGSDQTDVIGESIPQGTFTYEGVLGESGNGYQLVPIRPMTALPVELTGFTAVRSGSSVVLTWQTASETNNAGFRVQHEQSSGWREIGFVQSKATEGTTGEAQSYRFTVDRRLGPGTHRFRLQQIDLDGTSDHSEPVRVKIGMDGPLHLSAPAPNPASERAVLSFAVREGTKAKLELYNVLGQRIRTLYEGTPPGEEGRRLTLETRDLPSGVYVVRLQAGGQTRTERLTVVR